MGSKPSRHGQHSDTNETLNQETIKELCEETGFTEEELRNWHTNFYKDCPDGKLTLKQFEHEYAKIMGKPTHKTSEYVKHMFNVYDADKNQFIDFREFIMALSAASVVNRLRLVETLFQVFDLDDDGKITKAEIGKMLHTLVEVTETNRKQSRHQSKETKNQQESDLEKRIDDAFNELNSNDDDHITKDEFIEWYLKSGLLSETPVNEIIVTDTSRVQQLERKSRKTKQLNNDKKTYDHHQMPLHHMSHMTEHKPVRTHHDDDDNDDVALGKEVEEENSHRQTSQADSDDTDSHTLKENERWQHLFNSVLGQIRAQRAQENANSSADHFHSWKQAGEEKLKMEYFRQKSTSSDVVTIRL